MTIIFLTNAIFENELNYFVKKDVVQNKKQLIDERNGLFRELKNYSFENEQKTND